MYIYASYNNSTKAVTEYQIVETKQPAYANAANGYKVNILINDNVPAAFYEEFDNYKVTIDANDSSIATLSIINSGKSGIKRKLGATGLYNQTPYKTVIDEVGTATRADAIIALPWATERANTISSLGVL